MSGPPPSTLVLISGLKSCAPGDKVRFLGCVERYQTQTGMLHLKHEYPAGSSNMFALVNIDHVFEAETRVSFDVGAWVNVIGYVERRQERARGGVCVQAVTAWDAGNVDLNLYQKAVDARTAAGR